MIDFLYTRKPLIKTSNYHKSCDLVPELDGRVNCEVKGNPRQDMKRVKFEESLLHTLDNSDLKS